MIILIQNVRPLSSRFKLKRALCPTKYIKIKKQKSLISHYPTVIFWISTSGRSLWTIDRNTVGININYVTLIPGSPLCFNIVNDLIYSCFFVKGAELAIPMLLHLSLSNNPFVLLSIVFLNFFWKLIFNIIFYLKYPFGWHSHVNPTFHRDIVIWRTPIGEKIFIFVLHRRNKDSAAFRPNE